MSYMTSPPTSRPDTLTVRLVGPCRDWVNRLAASGRYPAGYSAVLREALGIARLLSHVTANPRSGREPDLSNPTDPSHAFATFLAMVDGLEPLARAVARDGAEVVAEWFQRDLARVDLEIAEFVAEIDRADLASQMT